MDYLATLLSDRNKANIQRIADHIGRDRKRFAALMELVLHGTSREAQLASWAMSIACEAHPELGGPWGGKMLDLLDLLDLPLHQGVHRNLIRTLQFCPLPKALHGRITEVMFAIVQDQAQPIASRAFSITVGMRMVKFYPELAAEFKLLLEEALRVDPGPAVRSRATKAMRTLDRQARTRTTTFR